MKWLVVIIKSYFTNTNEQFTYIVIIGKEWTTLCWWGLSGGAIHTPCNIDIISYVVCCMVCNRDRIDCAPLRTLRKKSRCLLWLDDCCVLRSACRCLLRSACSCLVMCYVLSPSSWCTHCVEGSRACCIPHIDWGWFGFLCNQKFKNISNIWSIKNKHDD